MTIKSFIIAAATGLTLLAALPASAQHAATPRAQMVNHYQQGHAHRQIVPLRQIFRILHLMDRHEYRRGQGRRHYRQSQRRRHHDRRRHQRRYY